MSITVAITAWMRYVERLEYLGYVVNSLHDILPHSTSHGLNWMMGVESQGVDSDLQNALLAYCRVREFDVVTNPGEPCLGTNMNCMIDAMDDEFFLYVQDDFRLVNRLPLDDDIRFLRENPDFGMVRYSWAAQRRNQLVRTDYNQAEDLRHPVTDELIPAAQLREIRSTVSYFYSFHPFLARKSYFTDVVGPYEEIAGAEWEMNVRAKTKAEEKVPGSRIAVRGAGPAETPSKKYFLHIGQKTSMTEKYEQRVARGRDRAKDPQTRYQPAYPDISQPFHGGHEDVS